MVVPIESSLNLFFKIVLLQIIILGRFSKELNCTIPLEFIRNLFEFKFEGKGESTFHGHLFQVVCVFLSKKIYCKHVMARLLTLTFEGHLN